MECYVAWDRDPPTRLRERLCKSIGTREIAPRDRDLNPYITHTVCTKSVSWKQVSHRDCNLLLSGNGPRPFHKGLTGLDVLYQDTELYVPRSGAEIGKVETNTSASASTVFLRADRANTIPGENTSTTRCKRTAPFVTGKGVE